MFSARLRLDSSIPLDKARGGRCVPGGWHSWRVLQVTCFGCSTLQRQPAAMAERLRLLIWPFLWLCSHTHLLTCSSFPLFIFSAGGQPGGRDA